jgi:hypothetical protein
MKRWSLGDYNSTRHEVRRCGDGHHRLLLAACAGTTQAHRSTLESACSESNPCMFHPGEYVTGPSSILEGITLTLSGTWSSTENDEGELNLTPADRPSNHLFLWIDMVAVKSTGAGHGTTPLTNVGASPGALIAWLAGNPDFRVVSPPVTVTIGHGLKTMSITIGVADSAQYGDSDCPSNPRCADLFTRPGLWGTNSYGIGGDGEVRLYISAINIRGQVHTFFVVLDAGDHHELDVITKTSQPVLGSLGLPAGVTVA